MNIPINGLKKPVKTAFKGIYGHIFGDDFMQFHNFIILGQTVQMK